MRFRCLAVGTLGVLLLATVAGGQVQSEALSGLSGEVIVPAQLDVLKLAGSSATKAKASQVGVTGQAFSKAWHVEIAPNSGGDYSVQFVSPVTTKLEKGDVVLLTAYARLISTADESNEGRIGFVLEQAKEPHSKALMASFGLTREWRRIDVPARIDQDLISNTPQLVVRTGYYVQAIEFGGVELRKLPRETKIESLPRTLVTYPGREASASWRAEAAERIEKIRKAELAITVVDGAGRPVPNAVVDVKMLKHAFVFGSCYNPKNILGDETHPDNVKYREMFVKLFNTGVDEWAMKWPAWVNAADREKAEACLKWMEEHGIAVRGHTMVWPGWKRIPPEINALASDPDALREATRQHILSVGKAFAGRVIDWDVVNEPFANNALMKILGEEVMADWFKFAREADSTAVLYLNETSVPTSPPQDERYTALYNRAKMIKDLGGPIGGVGMQAHFGLNVQPPKQLLMIYDRFATLGLPVRITEFDLDIADERLQADYYRDFLTATFSHPNVNGIMIWGFWEGQHWRPKAAMYRKDWSERPIAGVWNDLIFKQWWTHEVLKTSEKGTAGTRGFLGKYRVSVTSGDGKETFQEITLTALGSQLKVVLP